MKPLLLDLFCGAGGCAKGYADAGFSIIGVDREPQKRYPYTFVQMNVFDYMRTFKQAHAVLGFSAVHASPPCQKYSMATGAGHRYKHPDFIPPLRKLLLNTGLPYVIENVPGAPLLSKKTITLCGTMFGLGVFRHRLFESHPRLYAPKHSTHIGYIGDGRYCTVTGGCTGGRLPLCKEAMGIEWMTRKELVQAIPPTYTEYIGKQLLNTISGCESNIT